MAVYKEEGLHNPYYKEIYFVEGELTDEDIYWINSINRKTLLKFQNTKKLNSKVISKINNDLVTFSIEGGEKRNYSDRKEISSLGLATVLYYLETIESELDPNWTQLQKAMYIYNVMCTDFKYVEELKDKLSDVDICRSLTGILYGKLTCAGFATVYKEFMDRIGITCFFEGVQGVHRYNVLEIGDNYYGIDVTWDNYHNNGKKISSFNNFGLDKKFYYHEGHLKGKHVLDNKVSIDDINFLKQKYNYVIPNDTVFSSNLSVEEYYRYEKERKYKEYAEIDDEEVDQNSIYNYTINERHLTDEEIFEKIKKRLFLNVSQYDKDKSGYFIPDNNEKRFNLSLLTREQIDYNLVPLKDKLNCRSKKIMDLSISDDKTRKRFLPNSNNEIQRNIFNTNRLEFLNEIKDLYAMIDMLNFYDINDKKYKQFSNVFGMMYGLSLDYTPNSNKSLDINGLLFNEDRLQDCVVDERPIIGWTYKGMNKKSDSKIIVKKAKEDIDKKIEEFYKKIIDDVIDNYDQLMNDYIKYKEEKRIDLEFISALIMQEFSIYMHNEKDLLKLNYRANEIKSTANKLRQKFPTKELSKEEMIARDKDFLYAIFSDFNEIKTIFESNEKRKISKDEFLQKMYDINYLKQIFNLDDFHLSDADYKELFDEIILDKQKNSEQEYAK